MRGDLVGTDAGDLAGDEFLLGHLLFLFVTGVQAGAKTQPFEGGAIKAGMEGILVAVPEAGRRAAGVAKRVDVEIAQLLGVSDELGKCSGSLGVIYIPLLPESCHHEMIFDDK